MLIQIQAIEADVAQSVERILGKDEVTSSSLVIGSIFLALPTKRGEFQCQETRYRWSAEYAAGAITPPPKTGGASRAVSNTKNTVASAINTRRTKKPVK